MVQTLFIKTDNEKALEAVKALAVELGLKFSPFDPDDDYTAEEEAEDLAIIAERRNDERVSWEEVKRILSNKEERDAL